VDSSELRRLVRGNPAAEKAVRKQLQAPGGVVVGHGVAGPTRGAYPAPAPALRNPGAKSKYRSVKTECDGIIFDSKREAAYYADLMLQIKAGTVKSVERQVNFSLDVNGVHVCTYRLDFLVTMADGTMRYVEVKGYKTPAYKIKRKLVEALYAIKVEEV